MATGPMKLSDHKVQYWKGVLYGPPGVGKTIMACTSQRYRTFIFDVDNGIESVIAHMVKNGLTQDLVTFWPVKTQADFTEGYRWLASHWREFDLVVIDSMTEMQKMARREALKAAPQQDPRQMWGGVLDVMDFTTANFKGTPFHFLMVCHELTKEDPVTERPQTRPAFQGAFKEEYARHFSFIVRYTMWWDREKVRENGKERMANVLQRWLDCGPNPSIHFKDRSGALARWERPDIDALLGKMIASQEGPEAIRAIAEANRHGQPDDPAETYANQQAEKEKEQNGNEAE